MTTRAILYALLSAVLFGISTPTAKALLGSTDPTVLAGLLYCGAGVGVALIRHFVRPRLSPSGFGEVALKHRDLPWLAGAIIAGEPRQIARSEEHTSELQSPDHIVCRLLLEKKKKTKPDPQNFNPMHSYVR